MSERLSEEQAAELFARRDSDAAARDELILGYQPLAAHLSRRFAGRGESRDDLAQVAALALVKAVDRFDPDRGVKFTTFATATIVGELKRHLRDRAWAVRVPRRLQEAVLEVSRAESRLTHRLGRSPTIAEVAADTQLDEELVVEALEAGGAYTAASLDRPLDVDDGGATVGDQLGEEDESLRLAEQWPEVAAAVRALEPRLRSILYLRFYEDLTQSAIAERMGMSQMHVSRLLRQALAEIRAGTGAG